MRIALAQVNVSMGAVEANVARMGRFLDEAAAKGAELTLFPELAVVGYPPFDLLDREGFCASGRNALERLAAAHPDRNFIAGFVEEGRGKRGKGRFNAAAYVTGGKIEFVQPKRLLPTYDVFDEARYFDPGEAGSPVRLGGRSVGITICEDIWSGADILGRRFYAAEPLAELKGAGADVIVNLSASPYQAGKQDQRRKLVEKIVADYGLPVLYANLVGGNDELLFDGGSFALDGSGKLLARAAVFREDLVVADLGRGEGDLRPWPEEEEAWLAEALAMGIRDYLRKCGFRKAVLGLSGGIDSSLVALLAVAALGKEQVTGVSMPSRFTSRESREDAEETARRLGISFLTIPIDSIVSAYEAALAGAFAGRGRDVTEENIQARVRGGLLMALSNKFGWLVLSTGNKSELAVGYCTQYGDMAGGLAVISDLPKEGVYPLARFLNRTLKGVPERVFGRPPTAELRPNQKDEDSLPPYRVLDPILKLYVEELKSRDSIASAGFDPETVDEVVRLVERNEFKRRQAPPGLRLSGKAFGMGRRMPIARGPA